MNVRVIFPLFSCLLASALFSIAEQSEEPFFLVKDGVLAASVEDDDTPPTRLASGEFYRIMTAVTGCPTSDAAKTAALNRIRFRIEGDKNANDTISITRKGNAITLTGNNARAAGGAMYRLLEELGCRWYWPGEDGEYLPPESGTLAWRGLGIHETAAIRVRQLSTHPYPPKDWFCAHNRTSPYSRTLLSYGVFASWGGHSFGSLYPSDVKNREEYFQKRGWLIDSSTHKM